MRGPGYRNDLDVRRVWRCPQCGKQRRLSGEITTVTCHCGHAMQLVDERLLGLRPQQTLVSRELTVASFALTEEELARPVQTRTPRGTEGPPPIEPAAAPARPARKPRRESHPPEGAVGEPQALPEESAADVGADTPSHNSIAPLHPDESPVEDEPFGAGL